MRKYHVYGIGNALVDMEYEVDVSDLAKLRIDKGVMTLVDADHQIRIMDHLKGHQHRKGSGGSVANSIIAVSQFGGRGFHSCKVANDTLGRFYMDDLIAGGVDTNHHTPREDGHTGCCVVLVTPDSDRTMVTHLGVSGDLAEQELVPEALRASDYLYTEGYLVTSDSARRLSITAKGIAEAAGVKTAISLSDPNLVTYFKAGLMAMIGSGLDLLFANEAEARGMADTEDLNAAIAFLKTIAKEFAITRGPKGALVYDGNAMIEIAPVKVAAVDTLGAGDMFAGAFLYGRTQGWGHKRSGDLAAAASAKLVTSLGPRISTEETQAVLRRFL
ncbi:adenosine kinase [Candidatus Thiosymbion oneisti]|uniref:adenosine kinase n=1 Tax=Candidatus Thiosymbion oneisti TaxID=589554 RepID=UPI000B01F96C|nr:adenosine kinase [Candidatus Thiosymbion oneisti]